jgi:hypothetical protein
MAFTKDYAMIDLYPEKYESNQSVKQETPKKKATEIKEVQIKSGAKSKTTKEGQIIKVKIAPPPPVVKQVKFPPPIVKPDEVRAPKKAVSVKKIKFPPPIVVPDKPVPPPPPPVEPVQTSGNDQTSAIPYKIQYRTVGDIGKNPLIVNDGEIVKQQKDKIMHYNAKTLSVIPKNNAAAIAQYGEAARDGVIKLVEGTITFEAKPAD